MNWCPLINFTHYSLLKGFSKPEDLVEKCKNNNYNACGIADYKTISGCVSFFQACKKNNIKPILGCSFDDYVLFAKNKQGWLDLIDLISSLDEDGQLSDEMFKKIMSKNNLIQKTVNNLMPESYYVEKEDVNLHRILLCSSIKTTLPKIQKQLDKGVLPKEIEKFFTENRYYVLSSEESQAIKTTKQEQDEFDNFIDGIEEYDILSKPILPKFECPGGISEEDYLKQLCRIGWRELLINQNKITTEDVKNKYAERFKEEFSVIKKANLFGYFLIVQDIIKYVNDSGWLSGPGRGSAAGCLISYLIGITKIDPLEFDLLFSRFYNEGRNTKDNISLPDIDIDVPSQKRDNVIEYLKNKYGHDKVSQMITFGRLQGRSAIKEVLRAHEACSFAEMNVITKYIPNEAEISDQLADMEDEERSIIKWALIHNSTEIKDFCFINESGELEGEYAKYFQEAIDIEGTFKTQGKHAAGVVISSEPLAQVCPMVKQKGSQEKIAGLEMSDLESLGHVKFDILGLSLLEKLMYINDLTGC
jgi:DNA polymerase-3 subunit alpha